MANLDAADAVILDARTLEEYAEGHIPGAVNINFPLNAAPEPPKFWKSASSHCTSIFLDDHLSVFSVGARRTYSFFDVAVTRRRSIPSDDRWHNG